MPSQQVKLAVVRKDGVAYLEYAVPEVVRNIWAARGLEQATSTRWPGLKFYKLRNQDRTQEYTRMLEQHGLYDDFGAELCDEQGRFNVAFLRSVSASGKIPMNGEMSYASVASKVRSLAAFTRQFVEGFVSDYRITGSVEIEL